MDASTETLTLAGLRQQTTRVFMLVSWAHIPVFLLLSLFTPNSGLVAAGIVLVFTGAATMASRNGGDLPLTRYLFTVALMTDCELWSYMLAHTPYQIEGHFTFFIFGAMIMGYICWTSVLIGAVHAAVHHFVFNIAFPEFVFPGGTDWPRFLIHAVAVVCLSAFAVWMVWLLNRIFAAMATAVAQAERQAVEVQRVTAEREAAGSKSEEERRSMLTALSQRFDASVSGAARTVETNARQVANLAASMADLSQQAGGHAAAVVGASDHASSSVQGAAAATEELSVSVADIGRRVAESADIAKSAVAEAGRTNEIVQGLASAAQKIGEVVKLINDIASQTNLLALNATIEAARAGDAGKGFAVVANEVKGLANQTAKATDEIAQQIGAVQSETTRAVEAIRHVGDTIQRIDQISATIAGSVEMQASTTRAISSSVAEAAACVAEVASALGGMNTIVRSTEEAARKVLNSADGVAKDTGSLKDTVVGFISQIRI
jgi:methyl-accepting chemotaxis protein